MPIREKDTWANQLVEIVGAVRLLSRPGGATNDELIDALEIGERTLFRLKRTLEKMGIPIIEVEGTSGDRKRWRISSDSTLTFPKTSNLGLNTPELLSLYALRAGSGLFRGSAIGEDIDSAFAKIGMILSPATRSMLGRFANAFLSAPTACKDYSESDEIIEELTFAIIDSKVCNIRYHSFSDDIVKKYDIKPLHFFEREGGLYLMVQVADYEDVRVLAVERIQEVVTSSKSFKYPSSFNPEDYLSTAFSLYFEDPVEVKIRFADDQARYVRERVWAQKQKIEESEDGSILLTINTSGWWDIKRWVMSFGSDAEVLEPVKMRQEIAAELSESLKRYCQKVN